MLFDFDFTNVSMNASDVVLLAEEHIYIFKNTLNACALRQCTSQSEHSYWLYLTAVCSKLSKTVSGSSSDGLKIKAALNNLGWTWYNKLYWSLKRKLYYKTVIKLITLYNISRHCKINSKFFPIKWIKNFFWSSKFPLFWCKTSIRKFSEICVSVSTKMKSF